MEWKILGEDENDASVQSVYHEAISIVTRQGAPLANASIDRRRLQQYASTLTDEATSALICLCCARTYPHISSKPSNDMLWNTLLSPGDDDKHYETFLSMKPHTTQTIFGFNTFVNAYGTVEEHEVAFAEDSSTFNDWKLTVPFAAGNVMI